MAARERKNNIRGIVLVFLLLGFSATGQESLLSRKISITFQDISLSEAMDRISQKGGFRFSYDATLLGSGRRVSLNVRDIQVSKILDRLFNGEISYRQVGDYVILSAADPVRNPRTNKKSDTDMALQPARDTLRKIDPRPATEIDTPGDSLVPQMKPQDIDEIGLVRLIVPSESRTMPKNPGISRKSAVQVSLLPVLGTNGKKSGTTSNAFSLNILAGYSRSLNGFEAGGLLNIERFDICGFQVAGISNMTGGTVYGVQAAGAFNISLGPVHGVQLTAGVNRLSDSLKGVQVSGLCNQINGTMKGLQFTGFVNVSKSHVDGCQVSGLINIGKKEINGTQVCGFMNYGKENWGFQLAGITNIAKKDNRGAQVAGIFNYAKRLNGFQLALVNFTEQVDNGIPMGFLSIVRHDGYYRGEISADEIFYGNIVFRSGIQRFYNIYKTGIGESGMVNFTWGFGTMVPVKRIVSICFDLISGVVMTTQGGMKYHGLLTKLAPTVDICLLKHLCLFAGPSVNFYWYYTGNASRPGGIAPYTIYQKVFTNGPHGIEVWIGGVLGVKI
jgi:hypothetical protein